MTTNAIIPVIYRNPLTIDWFPSLTRAYDNKARDRNYSFGILHLAFAEFITVDFMGVKGF